MIFVCIAGVRYRDSGSTDPCAIPLKSILLCVSGIYLRVTVVRPARGPVVSGNSWRPIVARFLTERQA